MSLMGEIWRWSISQSSPPTVNSCYSLVLTHKSEFGVTAFSQMLWNSPESHWGLAWKTAEYSTNGCISTLIKSNALFFFFFFFFLVIATTASALIYKVETFQTCTLRPSCHRDEESFALLPRRNVSWRMLLLSVGRSGSWVMFCFIYSSRELLSCGTKL